MADNITVNPGSGGATIATDDIAGKHYQRVKLTFGVDGAAADVSATDPLPVTGQFYPATQPVSIAGTVPVAVANASLAVTGPLTDAQLRASAVTLQYGSTPTVTVGNASLAVTGPVTDAQLRASPVAISAAALPLPAGAATEASVAAIAAAVQAEDSPHVSGHMGIPALAIRAVADTVTTDTDGDYTLIKVDEEGRVKVAVKPASYALTIGSITAVAGAVAVNVSRISNVMAHVRPNPSMAGHNCTFEGSLNSTNGTDGNWFTIQAVRSNANTIETATGALSAAPVYGWELSVNGLNWFRVRATAHTSGTAEWSIQPAAYATEPIPAAQASATQAVSGTVTASATTPTPLNVNSAATTNATLVKGSAGTLYGLLASNTAASPRYLKLYNKATAPAPGTDVPVMTIALAASSAVSVNLGALGHRFATGIGLAITGAAADNDATAIGASEVKALVAYV